MCYIVTGDFYQVNIMNNNVQNRSKRSGTYHLKADIQAINSILHSNQTISSKCINMWPYIDNITVYESLVNPEDDQTKKNHAAKLKYLEDKMKEFKILDAQNKVQWNPLTQDQTLIIYALFVDIFFGVM
jgi:hypothetical protein